MDSLDVDPTRKLHVVAMPYPGRGHINPMMNLCKLIASRRAYIVITFIVTEEWRGFLSSDSKPANIRFRTIPNVIPSELVRAKDFPGFQKATVTEMEAPVEQLLDQLEPPKPSVIIYDIYLGWVVGLGSRRNIPVASLWTMSAVVFSMFHHYDILVQNGHVPANLSERGKEIIDYIPGVASTLIADLPTFLKLHDKGLDQVLYRAMDAISRVPNAQYLLFTSFYELERQVIDTLKPKFSLPIYSIGPAIPYFEFGDNRSPITGHSEPDYMKWLDVQPRGSVLYISQGSFLSVSSAQLDEIVAGIHDSGVRYLWVARGEISRFKEGGGDRGLVVPWCDQLKVLCHSSVGGFWSHCGWNSTKEAIFGGVPVLTFPIFWDQIPNSKRITEDWKIGWRVKREEADETVMTREEMVDLCRGLWSWKVMRGKK
ncbi:unnamed protein product [Ilex paraguariensis]|uniref:Uncharacterized protein n=1 Tax=Ilex paraguariensis TaxID=185542 RepID=A0ABC8TAI3_9AQUA